MCMCVSSMLETWDYEKKKKSISKLFDTSVKDKKAVNFWQEKMLGKKKLMS